MPLYDELNFDYLDTAVKRAEYMLEKVSGIGVTPFPEPRHTPPIWWLYPATGTPLDRGESLVVENWSIVFRLILGYLTEGYDGNVVNSLWLVLPRVRNYFRAHKRLVVEPGQRPPLYLKPDATQITLATPLGVLPDQFGHIGLEFRLDLQFEFELEDQY